MEELQARHRTQQRELQATITQRKKGATKKTRKGVNDQCDVLQRELHERQQGELAALKGDALADDMNELCVGDTAPTNQEDVDHRDDADSLQDDHPVAHQVKVAHEGTVQRVPEKKPNRQKARLARRAAEQEAQAVQAAEEASNLPDRRQQEAVAMQRHIEVLGLTEIAVRPDGHCLYPAIALQLPQSNTASSEQLDTVSSKPYQRTRKDAATFIEQHPDDFAPFLEEPLDWYVAKIQDSAEWGGQIELQALARGYSRDIHVLQADGRIEKIESGTISTDEPLWLAYYRNSFGLGEHYNALKKHG